jgi:uncharacterized membrane protein
MPEEHCEAVPEIQRINRRRMAWVSLALLGIITLAIVIFIPESRMEKIINGTATDWIFISFAGIIASYMGAKAVEFATKVKGGIK